MSAAARIRVLVAEHITGDVMGQLSTSGATVQGLESTNGSAVIVASLPVEVLPRFEKWLQSFTNGNGSLERLPE